MALTVIAKQHRFNASGWLPPIWGYITEQVHWLSVASRLSNAQAADPLNDW